MMIPKMEFGFFSLLFLPFLFQGIWADFSPNNPNQGQIPNECEYPCRCGQAPDCPPGIALIRDGCGCCWQCARQEGEACNGETLCDASIDLACVYQIHTDSFGVCRVMEKLKCSVNNQSFQDGETFLLDCRTQCTCKNGTYACVSLCPTENIHPSLFCEDPHLITVPGQCCREWRCKARSDDIASNPCEPRAGKWTDCSANDCGLGSSYRWYLDSYSCQIKYENRLCQHRPCLNSSSKSSAATAGSKERKHISLRHHVRRSHMCRATQRFSKPVRLQIGSCVSDRKYRPKFCGSCSSFNCSVFSATTISILFLCPSHEIPQILQSKTENVLKEHSEKFSIYDIMDEGQPIKFENEPMPDLQSFSAIFKFNNKIIAETFFAMNDTKYSEIINDDHEKVYHKVQWIMRCHCYQKF